MAINQQTLETELEAAKAALSSGDHAGARQWVTKAEITLAGLPDYGIGDRYVRYRQAIQSLNISIAALEADSAGSRKNGRVFARYARV